MAFSAYFAQDFLSALALYSNYFGHIKALKCFKNTPRKNHTSVSHMQTGLQRWSNDVVLKNAKIGDYYRARFSQKLLQKNHLSGANVAAILNIAPYLAKFVADLKFQPHSLT